MKSALDLPRRPLAVRRIPTAAWFRANTERLFPDSPSKGYEYSSRFLA
jgi:hypothetical protein